MGVEVERAMTGCRREFRGRRVRICIRKAISFRETRVNICIAILSSDPHCAARIVILISCGHLLSCRVKPIVARGVQQVVPVAVITRNIVR